jgi:hypothetical protein
MLPCVKAVFTHRNQDSSNWVHRQLVSNIHVQQALHVPEEHLDQYPTLECLSVSLVGARSRLLTISTGLIRSRASNTNVVRNPVRHDQSKPTSRLSQYQIPRYTTHGTGKLVYVAHMASGCVLTNDDKR